MAKNCAIVLLVSVLSLLCLINSIICLLSSREARILNTKLEMFENKLFTVLVDVDDIRGSLGTCQCPSQNSTFTDAIEAQLDTSKTSGIEGSESKAVENCVERITIGFSDEKQARKLFEKQMVNLIQDQIQSPKPIVFFNAKTRTHTLVYNVVVFDTVDANYGNGYSSTTGVFTCKIPGLYYFSVRFTSKSVSENGVVTYCSIRKNKKETIPAFNTASMDEMKSASASTYENLETGDTVDVGDCRGFGNVVYLFFHGALITES